MMVLMVALGGAVGAVARYAVGGWVHRRAGGAFPWATLSVNIAGGFLLGCTLPLLAADGPPTLLRALVTVGAIGAFTTVSTFAYEAAAMVRLGDSRAALLYAVASVGLGLASLVAGMGTAAALAVAAGWM
jgi:fluoride exporter